MKRQLRRDAALIARIRQVQVADAESRARGASEAERRSVEAEGQARRLVAEREDAWAQSVIGGPIDPHISLGFSVDLLAAVAAAANRADERARAAEARRLSARRLQEAQARGKVAEKVAKAAARRFADHADQLQAHLAEDRWRSGRAPR